LEVVVDSEARANRPASRTGWIPCNAHAGLQQGFRMICGEARIADQEIVRRRSQCVVKKVGTAASDLMPAIRYLVSQAQAEREIRFEFHFILKVESTFPLPVTQRRHEEIGIKRCWGILEKSQQTRIRDRARLVLSRSALVFLDALNPRAQAKGVLAFGPAHIIAACKQIQRVASGIVSVRGHD